jgi:hypothetical protein
MAGNLVQQIGADHGSGALLGSLKAQSTGLGPAVSYNTKFGSSMLSLGAKWEHDLDHHNTFGGDVVTVSAAMGF